MIIDPERLEPMTAVAPSQIVFDANSRAIPEDHPDVDRIILAMKQIESGNKFNTPGDHGNMSSLQYTPSTWALHSRQYTQATTGQATVLPLTEANQDAVAKYIVTGYVNQGYSPNEIASIWNSGHSDWEGRVGVNSMGQPYDVPGHVARFEKAYNAIGGTQQASPGKAQSNSLLSSIWSAITPNEANAAEGPPRAVMYAFDPGDDKDYLEVPYPAGAVKSQASPGVNVQMSLRWPKSQPLPDGIKLIPKGTPVDEGDVNYFPEPAVAGEGISLSTGSQNTTSAESGLSGIAKVDPANVDLISGVTQSFKNYGAEAAAQLNLGVAGFSDVINNSLNYVAKVTGLPPDTIFSEASKELRDNAEFWQSHIKNLQPVEEVVGGAVGGALPGITTFAMGIPYAALEGYQKGGIRGMFESIVRRASMGKILQVGNQLSMAPRVATMSAAGGAEAVASGATLPEAGKAAATMGIMGAAGPTKGKTAKQAVREFRESFPVLDEPKMKLNEAMRVLQGQMNSESGAVNVGDISDALVTARNALHDAVTVDPVPHLSRVSPELADAAVEHASSRIAVPHMVKDLLSRVFPDQYTNPKAMGKTIEVIVKDNILDGYDSFIRRAQDAYNQVRNARSQAQVASLYRAALKWEGLAVKITRVHNIAQYDLDVRRGLADPTIAANIRRWRQTVNPLLDQLYNEAKRVDANTPREGRGRHTQARINLVTESRAADLAKFLNDFGSPLPEGSIGSNHRNPDIKPDAFDRQALFEGTYSTDANLVLTSVLGPRWNEVTKSRLYDALVDSGAALWAHGIVMPDEIQGQKPVLFKAAVPETSSTGYTRKVERPLFIRKDLARELKSVLNADLPASSHPVARALTTIQLTQIADAVTHAKNIMSVVTRAQGAGSAWKDITRKMPVFGTVDAARRIMDVYDEISQDSPAIRKEMADMARQGLIRPQFPSMGIQKITHAQEFLHACDTASRLIMNRFYDNLVQRGLAVDSQANRRQFINQIGQYNSRLMGEWSRRFRDLGISPFIVAGRNFNRQGRWAVSGNPGLETTGPAAEWQMRVTNLFGTSLLATLPMMLNVLTTGSPFGRSGTPVGAWDLGKAEDEKGKHKVIDLLQLTGHRRGMRLTGIDALIEGTIAGHTKEQIASRAFQDSVQSIIHPWMGPPVGFISKALTGTQLDLRGKMEARVIPEGGLRQYVENLRAALESQNPLLYSIARPALVRAGIDRNPIKPYGKEVLDTFLKSPFGAFGVKDVYPARSGAQELALSYLRTKYPRGMTPEAAAQAETKQLLRQDYKVTGNLDQINQAIAGGSISVRQGRNIARTVNRPDLLSFVQYLDPREALKVYRVATPEEQAQIKNAVRYKFAHAKGMQREELEKAKEALR